MKRNTIIGIVICLVGIALMGFAAGRSDKTGENVGNLFYLGMVLAFSGQLAHFLPQKDDK